jgi:membrane protease YdiL (CAAX protease family)
VLLARNAPVRLEQPRLRAIADVIGGVVFAFFVSLCMIRVTTGLFEGAGWGAQISWESVWILACLACAPFLPSGVRHVVTLKSLIKGMSFDWPELAYSTYIFAEVLDYGVRVGFIGPLGLALAVGTAEEFLFRVLLLGWLVTRVRTEWALLVSSVVFGCAHLHQISLLGLLSVAPQFSGGMVLGAVYLRSRNPLANILCHASWDFPLFCAYGLGVSGGGTEGGMPSIQSLLPWIALACYGLWLVRPSVDVPGREPARPTVAHGASLAPSLAT